MSDNSKNREELVKEVEELRRRVVELEALDDYRKQLEASLKESEEKAKTLLEHIEDGYYEVDLTGKFLFCNESYSRILGWPKEDLIGTSYRETDQDSKKTYQIFNSMFRTGIPIKSMYRNIIRKDGSRRELESSVSLIKDDHDRPVGFRGIVRDITERKKADAEIAQWKQWYDLIVAFSGQVVNDYNVVTGTFLWGGSLEKVLGYKPEETSGRVGEWIRLIHPDDRPGTMALIERSQETRTPYGTKYRLKHKNGNYLWVHDRGIFLLNEEGKLSRILSLVQDITDQMQNEEKLRTLSLVDELTGLYNRRGFLTLAEQELKMANRLKRGMFLLFTDLDDLKGINDQYGHLEGDRALLAVATVIKETFRDPDIIARIGGDEFVVLAIEGTSESSDDHLRIRLNRNLGLFNAQSEKPYSLSLSMGVVRYDPDQPPSVEGLIAEADKRMYEEKGWKKDHPAE
jgi:diguanylate cyclase (GGDEF)-like protein/PAS domain S-box-containing protein